MSIVDQMLQDTAATNQKLFQVVSNALPNLDSGFEIC